MVVHYLVIEFIDDEDRPVHVVLILQAGVSDVA